MSIHFMLRFYGRVYRAPILYSTHTVIFAIAQLSCFSYYCSIQWYENLNVISLSTRTPYQLS